MTRPADPAAVGFDLDMTLVDSRPGIHAALLAFVAETGLAIDPDLVVSRLGPPIQTELAPFVAADRLPAALAVFRKHMAAIGVHQVSALPGAAAALAAVSAAGGRTVVVTSKHQPLALATLATAGLHADTVVGGVWAADKAGPLRALQCSIYVGDHLGDILAARDAAATAVAVATGPVSAEELAAAGADVVLADLTEFPAWLAAQRKNGH